MALTAEAKANSAKQESSSTDGGGRSLRRSAATSGKAWASLMPGARLRLQSEGEEEEELVEERTEDFIPPPPGPPPKRKGRPPARGRGGRAQPPVKKAKEEHEGGQQHFEKDEDHVTGEEGSGGEEEEGEYEKEEPSVSPPPPPQPTRSPPAVGRTVYDDDYDWKPRSGASAALQHDRSTSRTPRGGAARGRGGGVRGRGRGGGGRGRGAAAAAAAAFPASAAPTPAYRLNSNQQVERVLSPATRPAVHSVPRILSGTGAKLVAGATSVTSAIAAQRHESPKTVVLPVKRHLQGPVGSTGRGNSIIASGMGVRRSEFLAHASAAGGKPRVLVPAALSGRMGGMDSSSGATGRVAVAAREAKQPLIEARRKYANSVIAGSYVSAFNKIIEEQEVEIDRLNQQMKLERVFSNRTLQQHNERASMLEQQVERLQRQLQQATRNWQTQLLTNQSATRSATEGQHAGGVGSPRMGQAVVKTESDTGGAAGSSSSGNGESTAAAAGNGGSQSAAPKLRGMRRGSEERDNDKGEGEDDEGGGGHSPAPLLTAQQPQKQPTGEGGGGMMRQGGGGRPPILIRGGVQPRSAVPVRSWREMIAEEADDFFEDEEDYNSEDFDEEEEEQRTLQFMRGRGGQMADMMEEGEEDED